MRLPAQPWGTTCANGAGLCSLCAIGVPGACRHLFGTLYLRSAQQKRPPLPENDRCPRRAPTLQQDPSAAAIFTYRLALPVHEANIEMAKTLAKSKKAVAAKQPAAGGRLPLARRALPPVYLHELVQHPGQRAAVPVAPAAAAAAGRLPPLTPSLPPALTLCADAAREPQQDKVQQSMEELTGFTREMAVLLLLFTGLRALWHVGIPTYLGGERGCPAPLLLRRNAGHACMDAHRQSMCQSSNLGVALARRSPAALWPPPPSSWPARPFRPALAPTSLLLALPLTPPLAPLPTLRLNLQPSHSCLWSGSWQLCSP